MKIPFFKGVVRSMFLCGALFSLVSCLEENSSEENLFQPESSVSSTDSTTIIENADDTVIQNASLILVSPPRLREGDSLQSYVRYTNSRGTLYSRVTKKFQSIRGDQVGEVLWSSSDSSIATVSDSGFVEAVAPGKARIHAVLLGIKAEAEITVVEVKKPSKPIIPHLPPDENDSEIPDDTYATPPDEENPEEEPVQEEPETEPEVPAVINEAAKNPLDTFLGSDDVFVFEYGTGGGLNSDKIQIIYGPPTAGNLDVLSLGTGGSVTIQLKGYVPVDGEGADFTLFENAFYIAGTTNSFSEPASVAVSQDGETYYEYVCDFTENKGTKKGCAGVTPVKKYLLDYAGVPTEESGGDSFDLSVTDFEWVQFIKITDRGPKPNTPQSPGKGTNGFDFDSMVIRNGGYL